MAKLAVNEVTTYRWPFEEDASQYARCGFDGIGVWRRKLADFGEEKAKELLSETGLGVSSLGWIGGFTGADGRTLKESVVDGMAAIESAANLGAANLIVYSGARGGHTHNHARRLLLSALKELAPPAEELGVRLALEPMHPGCGGDWTFVHTFEDSLAVIEQVGSPALGLVIDVYHLGFDGRFLDVLSANSHAVALLQIGDAQDEPKDEQDRRPLGDGRLPLADALRRMNEAGYDGWVEIELIGPGIEDQDYEQLLISSLEKVKQWR